MNYQNEQEFKSLVDLFCRLDNRSRVLEIGSLHGETLLYWFKVASREATIVSIDMLVPPSDPRYRIQKDGHQVDWPLAAKSAGAHCFFCLDENSTDPHTVSTVKRLVDGLDFLFIDGGHDYATCLADWQNYGPLVRKGGLVAFHDLGREWPDVRRVWEQAKIGHDHHEFVVSPDRFGIGALYV